LATSFTNNWKNILDKLQSVFRDEFKGALKVYKGSSVDAGNQYLRIDPLGSSLDSYMSNSETREFSIAITYHFRDVNAKKTTLDHVLRYVSRIESLIHDNMIMTLSDSTKAIDCRVDECNLNQGDENEYVVVWSWKCLHVGNIS